MEDLWIGFIVAAGSSLLNFIATKIYNYITGKNKNFLWKSQNNGLSRLRMVTEFSELKKRTRIVVIDDEESFPISLFQDEGYSIDKWQTVKDFNKLENGFYDIIVLDIKGVAKHISEDDGLGVLENLKRRNPAQIIISYSQHSYDLSKIKFFQLADENIAKPSDYLKIKSIIDNLIDSQFKPGRYISALHQILESNNIPKRDIRIIDRAIYKSIENRSKPDWKQIISFSKNKNELANQVISISNTILKFFQ